MKKHFIASAGKLKNVGRLALYIKLIKFSGSLGNYRDAGFEKAWTGKRHKRLNYVA